jgi:K+-transporting ATPase ATPase C chain
MEAHMVQHFRPAFMMLLLFTLLLGLAYPFGIMGVSQALMPFQAGGSIITRNDVPVASALIGQNFTGAGYFHGRPSATSAPDPADASKTVDAPYNAANSSGSNLGPLSQKLVDRVKADVETERAAGVTGPVPADALTTSGSGLDPHISPAFALLQAGAIAKERKLTEERVRQLVQENVEGRLFGILGEPRVNVVRLNLALDALSRSIAP